MAFLGSILFFFYLFFWNDLIHSHHFSFDFSPESVSSIQLAAGQLLWWPPNTLPFQNFKTKFIINSNLFASIQSQWTCFLPQFNIPKFTRSLKQRNKTGYLWPFLCHSIHETYQFCLQKNDSFFFSKSQQCSFRLLFPNWYLCYCMLLFSSILYVDIRIYLKWKSDCHSLASNWLWLLIRYRIKPL